MVHIKKKNLFLFLFWLYFALQYCVGFAIHVHLWLIHVNVWQKKIFKKKEKKIQIVVVVLLVSHVWLFATPWTVACQAPLPMGYSRQEYWSGLPLSSPGPLLQTASNSENWTQINRNETSPREGSRARSVRSGWRGHSPCDVLFQPTVWGQETQVRNSVTQH